MRPPLPAVCLFLLTAPAMQAFAAMAITILHVTAMIVFPSALR